MSDSPLILVVDDSSDAREMLKMKGYKVLEAADGQKGVEIAKREHPDLILMEHSLTHRHHCDNVQPRYLALAPEFSTERSLNAS